MSYDHFNFIFLFSINQIRRRLEEIGAMFSGFLVSHKEGSVEDQVDLPSREDAVTVQGLNIIFSIIHLSPLMPDSPFTFTVSVMFFTNTFRYTIQ